MIKDLLAVQQALFINKLYIQKKQSKQIMKQKTLQNRYTKMKYNRCGNSGIKLPAISLGLWHNFGENDSYSNSRELLLGAFDLGITNFDLANNYGPPPGSAEITFGKILKQDLQPYRDEMLISTKAGYLMWSGPYGEWGSRKNLLASLDQSLKRMNLDYVDIFYSHRFDPNTPLEETMGALHTAVIQGKALYVGLSSYPPEQTRKAIKILQKLGTPCLLQMTRYNMFERQAENELLNTLSKLKIGGMAFCPLAKGLLTNRYFSGIPDDSRIAKNSPFLTKNDINKATQTKVQALNKIAINRGQSLAQLALVWLLQDTRINSVLIGASKIKQIKENVDSLNNLYITEEELKQIDKILNS